MVKISYVTAADIYQGPCSFSVDQSTSPWSMFTGPQNDDDGDDNNASKITGRAVGTRDIRQLLMQSY